METVSRRGSIAWMDAQVIETLFLSAITIDELRFGIAALPMGKRQTILRDRLEGEVLLHVDERILPFKFATSQSFSDLLARGAADGYIAATAAANGLAVAARDTNPFEAAGLKVINPLPPQK
jgi:predicted nucleic acid-binding protein